MSSVPVINTASAAHRTYVKLLYRKALKQSLDWIVFRDIWRQRAIEIRTEFERNRDVRDPRALARVLAQAEQYLRDHQHPDPYRPPTAADGSKWERNLPPPIFSASIREQARASFDREANMMTEADPEVQELLDMEKQQALPQSGGSHAPAS